MTLRKSIILLASFSCIVLCYVLGAWVGNSRGSQWDGNILEARQEMMKMIPSDTVMLAVGTRLPRSSFETLDGAFVHLDSSTANRSLLIIFDPACETCEYEIKQLTEMASNLDRKTVVLAISSANPIDLIRYKREMGIEIPILYDRGGILIRSAPYQVFPLNILVDSNLTVERIFPGALLSTEISELFKDK